MFCSKCGNEIVEDADFCHICGNKIIYDERTECIPPEMYIRSPNEKKGDVSANKPKKSKKVLAIVGMTTMGAIVLISLIGIYRLWENNNYNMSATEEIVMADAISIIDIAENSTDYKICFNGILISELLNSSSNELIQILGNNYNANDSGKIAYDEIEFYMLDDENVDSIWSFHPECFSINENTLIADSDGVINSNKVIELLGLNYEEEWLDSGYYITYDYPAYAISFGINKYSEVSEIIINNNIYFESDKILGLNETIENYDGLSGSYRGSMEGSMLNLSIYSSLEEGEVAIGNVEIYVGDEYFYCGEIISTEGNIYKIITGTEEEVFLIESMINDIIVLELYVNGQYIEEYKMEEKYNS